MLLETQRVTELQIPPSTSEILSFPPRHGDIGLYICCSQKTLLSFFLSGSESEDTCNCIRHGKASSEHLSWALYTAVASRDVVKPNKGLRDGAEALRGMT